MLIGFSYRRKPRTASRNAGKTKNTSLPVPTRKAPRRYAFLRILRTIPVPSALAGTGNRAAADGREQRRTEPAAGSHGPPPAVDIGGFRQSAFWGGKPTGIYSFQTAPALEAGGGKEADFAQRSLAMQRQAEHASFHQSLRAAFSSLRAPYRCSAAKWRPVLPNPFPMAQSARPSLSENALSFPLPYPLRKKRRRPIPTKAPPKQRTPHQQKPRLRRNA